MPVLRWLTLVALATACAAANQAAPASVTRAAPAKRPAWRAPIGPYRGAQRQAAGLARPADVQRGLVEQCTERWRDATLDHFGWGKASNATFRQRFYVCDGAWSRSPGAPVFFYLGNEADVTLYLNASGLMWESAPEFGALLVFAEHRYYGRSRPFGKRMADHLRFLSAEQALADYAELIAELRDELPGGHDSPFIGFGGSYGGMLASWFRTKYPHAIEGAIAGSAPIWSFAGERPAYDSGSFARIVTDDASPVGGAAPACADNVRSAWRALFAAGDDAALGAGEGEGAIQAAKRARKAKRAMRLCEGVPFSGTADAEAVAYWAASAFDYLAMGNYPYPSSYILNGDGLLPAYPMRAACERLAEPGLAGDAALAALADGIGVFYNFSGTVSCYDPNVGANDATDDDGQLWDYQACTEMMMQMTKDGVADMFWSQPWSEADYVQGCLERWGVTPDPLWPEVEWGGRRIGAATNIVWTNGGYDPWKGGGVLADVSPSAVAILIPEGAHHLDLMFSHPDDPASVTKARETQRAHMRRWVAGFKKEGAAVAATPGGRTQA